MNTFLRLGRLFREITHEEAQSALFVGEMVFHLYQHAAASNASYSIDASVQELAARLHDFVASPAGADKACLVQDPSYALLLLALALLPANSPHYAGILNEMGRYLQGYLASHTRADGRFNGDLHSPHSTSNGVVSGSHSNGNGYTSGSHSNNNGFTSGSHSNNNGYTSGSHSNGNGFTSGSHTNNNGFTSGSHTNNNGFTSGSHSNGNGFTSGSHTNNNGFTSGSHSNGNGFTSGSHTNNNGFTTGNSYTTNPYFETAIRVYEEAVLIFEKAGDGVNSSVVLSNFAQLIRQPFTAATLTLGECQTSYQLLHWVNTHLDAVLRSGCDEARKHAVRSGVWGDA